MMNLMDHMCGKHPADLQDLKGFTLCSDALSQNYLNIKIHTCEITQKSVNFTGL